MLTWLYLSAFAALFGAVINAQAERQTTALNRRKPEAAGQPARVRRRHGCRNPAVIPKSAAGGVDVSFICPIM